MKTEIAIKKAKKLLHSITSTADQEEIANAVLFLLDAYIREMELRKP